MRDKYKYCPRCGEYKPVTAFAKDGRSPDGLQGWCRACRSEAAKKVARKRATKAPKKQKGWPRSMTGEEFVVFYQDNGWLYRYIGSQAAMKTRNRELRKDLRQEAWIRISLCPPGLSDECYKQEVYRAIDAAYRKIRRAREYELSAIEQMSRDEYRAWTSGCYLP